MTMQILETARGVLEAAGYDTSVSSAIDGGFVFEDANVYGFCTAQDASVILSRWESVQNSFVRQQSGVLSRVPTKAWNVYGVYLSADEVSPEMRQELNLIEEDFRSIRKIARCGITTRDAVEAALAPLLPLRYAGTLSPVDTRHRIQQDVSMPSHLLDMVEAGVPAAEAAAQLLDRA
jgi:hypothetical protein